MGRLITEEEIVRELTELRIEHRKLDDEIRELIENPYADQLLIRRLKKRKLMLKDMLTQLSSMLIPDLDA
ncbi:MAG: YdcH family protein [bacterium]